MYINKEIIYVFLLFFFVLVILAIRFYLDFSKLKKIIRTHKGKEYSSSIFLFYQQFEEVIYNLNRITKRFNKRIMVSKVRIKFFEKFYASFPDPIIIINQDFQVIELNRKAVELLGNEAFKKNIFSVLRISELKDLIHKTQKTKKPSTAFVKLVYPSERVYNIWVSQRRKVIDSKLIFIRLFDSTEEKKIQSLQSEFIANVSHELRTPIASISGYCETLLTSAKNDKNVHDKFLKVIKKEASRMSSLVGDLLSLSRIERIEHANPKEIVDISFLLKEIKELTLNLYKKNKVIINFFLSRKVLEVYGDYNELKQVFINIIENAVKHGKSEKPIKVTLSDLKDEVKVAIKDFGKGIDKEHIPMLTNRFYRVDESRSRNSESTGLGLSIVKHILNHHNGRLIINSIPTKGSEFSVFLRKC